jgi:hypothetical protein
LGAYRIPRETGILISSGKRLIGQDYSDAAIQVEKLSIQLARKYDVDILCYANFSFVAFRAEQPAVYQVETD